MFIFREDDYNKFFSKNRASIGSVIQSIYIYITRLNQSEYKSPYKDKSYLFYQLLLMRSSKL